MSSPCRGISNRFRFALVLVPEFFFVVFESVAQQNNMRIFLNMGNIRPLSIGYVNAHVNGG